MAPSASATRFVDRMACGAALALLSLMLVQGPAHALSEIQREDIPPPAEAGEEMPETPPVPAVTGPVPLPDPVVPPREPDIAAPGSDDVVETDEAEALPEVRYGEDGLPEPVRRMRSLIMEACLSGDIERLRPLVGNAPNATLLSLAGSTGDPIEVLRDLSGDEEGHEILAILYEVLSAGHAHVDPGTPEELFVWPYFFAVPLESLEPRQRVELFMIVTAGDYEDMKAYGAYIFYRVGITPDGQWQFFVAGD